MSTVTDDLARLGIATLRYQFPYMERGLKRPDPPTVCHATVRAAVAKAAALAPGLPLFAGGRSFGGRMTSQAQSHEALPNVRRLAFLAFPLHPAKQPATERAEHLLAVQIPMLFLQGTCDDFAQLDLLQTVVARLGVRATLYTIADADHSFHVPARTGRKDADVRREALQVMSRWIDGVIAS